MPWAESGVTLWTSQPFNVGLQRETKFNVSSEPDVHVFGLWEEAGGTPEKKARGRLFVADTRWLQIIPKMSWISQDVRGIYRVLRTSCPQGVILTSSTRRPHTQA